jgi:hypothetical protein
MMKTVACSVDVDRAGYRSVWTNVIEPRGLASSVTASVDVTADSIWSRMLLPMLRRRLRTRLPGTLHRLKAAAERARHV